MAISQFSNPNAQAVYDAGLARLKEIERQKRAMATNAAARSGVATSGVGQLPQGEISRGAIMAESQLGSDVAQGAESERLADKRFEQQKEMFGLQQAAALRLDDLDYRRRQAANRSGNQGRLIGGLIGGGAGALLPGARVVAGAGLGSELGSYLS